MSGVRRAGSGAISTIGIDLRRNFQNPWTRSRVRASYLQLKGTVRAHDCGCTVMLDLWWRAFSTFFRWSSDSDTDKEVKADERRPCILAVHLGVRPSLTQPSWSCRHRLAVNVQTHSCVRGIRRGSQPTLPRRSISRSVVAKDYGATVDDSSPVRSVALLERTRGVLEASAALQWTR